MTNNIKDELYWICDNCGTNFTLGNGFIGSVNDFEYHLHKSIPTDKMMECNPFMSFIQMCNICCEIRRSKIIK